VTNRQILIRKPRSCPLLPSQPTLKSNSFGTKRTQKSQRLASSASTALSPTLSSSAQAANKPSARATGALASPAATLSSPALLAVEFSSTTGKNKSTPFGHRPRTLDSAGNIQSQPFHILGAIQRTVVDGERGSNTEIHIELDKPPALDSGRLPAISMSEAPTVLPLQSNCYRMGFEETIYKYEIVCESSSVLAKGERKLVEKAFLEELCIRHQRVA